MRITQPDFNRLPETIVSPRTDPVYNCHGYLTKVPIAAIEPFIETFTTPGEVVVDFFAGSGMTGLAAMRLGRDGVLSDISALGQHIAKGYSTEVEPTLFKATARTVIQEARRSIGDLYTTIRAEDKERVEMVRIVWSFTYCCPSCNYDLLYFAHLSNKGAAPKVCPKCSTTFVRRAWPRGPDVPMEIVVRSVDGHLVSQAISDYDRLITEKAIKDVRQKDVPGLLIDADREMFSRSGLGKANLTNTKNFFSPRNSIALLELWRVINTISDEALRQKVRFVFTAILPRASRRYQWSPQRPLNAQNQTYYIAPVYYEWNVFELFNRKVEATIRSDEKLFGNKPLFKKRGRLNYVISSADRLLHVPNSSVDYVFTDPPFGSNIFYSDMSLFHEAWLGKTTDATSEAVVYTTGKRKNGSAERYENLLRKAFSEAFRILKPGRCISVVFGNSSGHIWGLVQRAMRDAGFTGPPVHLATLDKGQRSVKGLNSGSESVVTVDLIVTMQKPVGRKKKEGVKILRNGDSKRLIKEAIKEISLKERNASHVYGKILRKAIKNHYVLDHLHLTDVLVALRNAGYRTNRKTGLLCHVKGIP